MLIWIVLNSSLSCIKKLVTNLGQFAYSKTVIKVSTTGSAQAPSPLAGLKRPGHRGGPRGHALPHAASGGTKLKEYI